MNAVSQWRSWCCIDGNLSIAAHCNSDAVEYEQNFDSPGPEEVSYFSFPLSLTIKDGIISHYWIVRTHTASHT